MAGRTKALLWVLGGASGAAVAYWLLRASRRDAWNFQAPLRMTYVTGGWWDARPDGRRHQGVDFRAAVGTPVYAVGDGVVTRADSANDSTAGKWVGILHAYGLTSRYMHLDTVEVKKGQRVKQGDRIGTTGATGIQNSTPHLHFDFKLLSGELARYANRFGKPSTGWGSEDDNGFGVPAEPLVPSSGYNDRVLAQAREHAIKIYG